MLTVKYVNGKPLADIPDGIFIDGYDTSALKNQLAQISREIALLNDAKKTKECLDCNQLAENEK